MHSVCELHGFRRAATTAGLTEAAIDALIATHAVVMDATARELWVSEGPHLVGRFVRFDLNRLLGSEPALADDLPSFLDEDPIAKDGRYDAWVRDGSRHGFVEGGGDGR